MFRVFSVFRPIMDTYLDTNNFKTPKMNKKNNSKRKGNNNKSIARSKNKTKKRNESNQDRYSFEYLLNELGEERLYEGLSTIYPCWGLEDARNPFFTLQNLPYDDYEKAKIFSQIIRKLARFGLECVDIDWDFDDTEKIKQRSKKLTLMIKIITEDLKKLKTKEANKKVKSHTFLRISRKYPEILQVFVKFIISRLKQYQSDIKIEQRHQRLSSKVRDDIRKEAIKRFFKEDLEKVCQLLNKFTCCTRMVKIKKIDKDSCWRSVWADSDPKVAIWILSYINNCSYKRLEELYYPVKNNKPVLNP